MSVHKQVREASPPGDWVDTETCACGEHYKRFRTNLDWAAVVALVRAANGGDWFPSRGPVLWMWHCLKLDAWYFRHRACEQALEYDLAA